MCNDLELLGIKISRIGFHEGIEAVDGFVKDGQKHFITTPYSESIVEAQKDELYRIIVNSSDLAVPDGVGILAAVEFLSYRGARNKINSIILALLSALPVFLKIVFYPAKLRILKERVSGSDLLLEIARLSETRGYRIYLLGGRKGVAEKAAGVLKKLHPALEIGYSSGPADLKSSDAAEADEVVAKINEFGADFLFAAFRPIEQEKWIWRHWKNINAKVFMPVGGALDMISGEKSRAPFVFRRFGLEWLWRLMIEPSRIRRIYKAIVVFPWLVFKAKISP